jgi:LysR family nitrogen assimilation transcriptional regulator
MNGAGARKLSVIVETNSLEHIKAMVEDGFGYSILAHAAASQELLAGDLSAARIKDFDLRRNVSVVRSPSYGVSRASVAIEDIAVRLLREMMADGRWIVEEALDSTGEQ